MLERVTQREMERIFEVTDRLGIHRESLVVPLGARHPGCVRRMPNGKIEIVVESQETTIVNVTCARCLGTGFPWGTFIINISGSTVMGLIAGYLAFKGEASQPWRLFLMTGILGGYTTFSAYSLDAALLYERGELGLAALYVIGSVVLSIAGLFGGLALVRHFS